MADMSTDKMPFFARRLVELRTAAELSQYELAKRTGLTRQAMSLLELGERQPNWETVQRLAAILGTSCQEFTDPDMKFPEQGPARSRGRPPKATPATPPAEDLIETRKKGRTPQGLAPPSFEPETIPQTEGKKPKRTRARAMKEK